MENKILKLEQAIEKLQEESEEIQQKIDDIKKKAEDNHQSRISSFKKTTRPLDDASAIVEDEKEKLVNKIDQTQIEIERSISEKESKMQEID